MDSEAAVDPHGLSPPTSLDESTDGIVSLRMSERKYEVGCKGRAFRGQGLGDLSPRKAGTSWA